MKVAFVHDWLTGMRGGEKVLEELVEIFPESEIFTLLHIKGSVSEKLEGKKIHTSFVQRLPFKRKFYRHYLPLFPAAIESFNLKGFDLVFSSSHCVAKGAIPYPGTPHICYCHTPMRYAWDLFDDYFGEKRGLYRIFINTVMSRLREWDVASSSRVDIFIANSNLVRERIKRYYRREAEVIHPPIDTDFYMCKERRGDYYLMVSSHVPYKRIDIAIKAFSSFPGEKLIIVGKGPLLKKHRKMAPANVEFLFDVNDDKLRELYCHAKALIHTAREDFGMVMAEAQSCGVPVIAYGAGGSLDIVREGTGVLFPAQTAEDLKNVLSTFNWEDYSPEEIRRNALRFSKREFRGKILNLIERIT